MGLGFGFGWVGFCVEGSRLVVQGVIWKGWECIHRWLRTILRICLDEGVWMVLVVDKEQRATPLEILDGIGLRDKA